MNTEQLTEAWQWQADKTAIRLPVKTLQYNRCPAVAPLSVLDASSAQRLQIDKAVIQKNLELLRQSDLAVNVLKALKQLDHTQQTAYKQAKPDVDAQLYDGFIGDADKQAQRVVRSAGMQELASLDVKFSDDRLRALFPRYKARNYPSTLTDSERAEWDAYRYNWLMGGDERSRLGKYFSRLAELAADSKLKPEQQFLLEELQLYGQSIIPVID